MPTKNYFNLQKSKQDAILNSAKNEFSCYAYEDVSIFQIAKNAGISRASFYCYFSDKLDIYKFVLSEILDEIKNYISKISAPPYDVFDAIKFVFEYLTLQKNTNKQNLITKALENFNPKIEQYLTCNLHIEHKHCIIDFSNLNITKDQARYFGFAIISCLVFHILEYYHTNISSEQITKKFTSSLNILKHGTLKE